MGYRGFHKYSLDKCALLLPVAIVTATIAEIVAVDIANKATVKAPMYTAVTQAKKRAKKPPTAAKETRREIMMALRVAAKKNSRKMSNPVSARKAIVPTCKQFQM